MIFKYYEVTEYKPRLDYKKNTYHESESLGFFSSKEKAKEKLRTWCESKGIPFEQNYYPLNQIFLTKLEDTVSIVSVAGLFFDCDDKSVDYDKDWDYGSYAAVTEKELLLDMGE